MLRVNRTYVKFESLLNNFFDLLPDNVANLRAGTINAIYYELTIGYSKNDFPLCLFRHNFTQDIIGILNELTAVYIANKESDYKITLVPNDTTLQINNIDGFIKTSTWKSDIAIQIKSSTMHNQFKLYLDWVVPKEHRTNLTRKKILDFVDNISFERLLITNRRYGELIVICYKTLCRLFEKDISGGVFTYDEFKNSVSSNYKNMNHIYSLNINDPIISIIHQIVHLAQTLQK